MIQHTLAQNKPYSGVVRASTINASQGHERTVVVLDLTAAPISSEDYVGFVGDERRFNVALTRAKQGLIIVGDFKHWLERVPTLQKGNANSSSRKFVRFIEDIDQRKAWVAWSSPVVRPSTGRNAPTVGPNPVPLTAFDVAMQGVQMARLQLQKRGASNKRVHEEGNEPTSKKVKEDTKLVETTTNTEAMEGVASTNVIALPTSTPADPVSPAATSSEQPGNPAWREDLPERPKDPADEEMTSIANPPVVPTNAESAVNGTDDFEIDVDLKDADDPTSESLTGPGPPPTDPGSNDQMEIDSGEVTEPEIPVIAPTEPDVPIIAPMPPAAAPQRYIPPHKRGQGLPPQPYGPNPNTSGQ